MGETLSKGASSSSVSAAYDLESLSSNRLLEASQRGQLDIVSKLLRRGKKPNKVDDHGDTALHKAAAWGHVEVVAALLKKHAELALEKNAAGLTPFHLAAQFGKLECARLLLDAQPKLVNTPFSRNPVNFDYSLLERSGKVVWSISNFSRIEEKKVYSDVFQLGGSKWRLVLYPRGSKGDENLSLYLEVANHEKLAEGWSYLVSFTFGVVNQLTGRARVMRDVVAHRFYKTHTDLGFPQMVKKSTLYNRKNGIILRDRLQVALSLKSLDASTFGLEENCGTYTCRLNGFSKTKDSRMISNTFYIAGAPWALAVYPKGKQIAQTLSIYLKIVPPSIQPHYASTYTSPLVSRDEPPEKDEIAIDTPNALNSDRNGVSVSVPANGITSASPPQGSLASTSTNALPATGTVESDPNAWSYVVNFRISLLNQLDGSKFTRSVDAKIFKHKCEDWGFPQFIKLSTLLNPENGFLDDDAILLEVALEVVEFVRPQALPTRHLISTFPSTPSHLRPTSPTGPGQANAIFPSNSASNATIVPIGAQGAASFSIPLRKPISTHSYKNGVDWQLGTPIKTKLNFMPLHWAIFCGNLEAVSELLARQADIDAVDANGRTPLDWACYYGHYDLAKLLLANGASGNIRDHESAKPIHKAAFIGSPDIIQLMLHHFKNLNTDLAPIDKRRKASIEDEQENSALVLNQATSKDDHLHNPMHTDPTLILSSETIPTTGAQMPPSPRKTILTSSKDSSRDGSPHKLLTASKDSTSTAVSDLDGLTSSQQGTDASEGDEVVSSLKTETGGLASIADSSPSQHRETHHRHSKEHHRNSSNGSSGTNETNLHSRENSTSNKHHHPHHPLQSTLTNTHSESSSRRRSSESGPSNLVSNAHSMVHSSDSVATTSFTSGSLGLSGPAFASVGGNAASSSRSLVGSHGASVGVSPHLTSSTIGIGSYGGDASTAPFSAQASSSKSSSNMSSVFPLALHTPLQQCLRMQRNGLAEQLVEDFDGDVNVVDLWGRSPLHLAAYSGDINLLELFLSRSHPQLINHQDKDGFTALHKAIARGYFDCVQVLLNADADIGLTSKSGYTPFHYAVLLNELQSAKMILEFDPRRGTAPVPLREHLEAARRSSDVVDSDVPLLPLEREKKRATVSISDTIQLMHPTAAPSMATPSSSLASPSSNTFHPNHPHLLASSTGANPTTNTPNLYRPPTERAALNPLLGILHHPPGSDAAIAKQMLQLKRSRGTNSDEELFEQKDSVVATDEVLSTHPTSTKVPPRRRSVNFHGDNAVVRIKQHNMEESETPPLDHDSAVGTANASTTANQRKHTEESLSSDDDKDAEDSSGQQAKFLDLDGALSADSDENDIDGDEDWSKSRKRSHTMGNERTSNRNIIKRYLSDDDSGFRGRYYIDVHHYRDEEDSDPEDDDAGPEESSESLSVQMRPGSPVSFKHERTREREHYQVAHRGRSLTRSKENATSQFSAQSSTSALGPPSHLDLGHSKGSILADANEAQRQEDVNLDLGYHASSSAKRAQNDPNVTTSSRKTMFGSSRSRSTGAFQEELSHASPGTAPPVHGLAQPSIGLMASVDVPKPRSSKLSGLLKAFSGRTSEYSSAALSSSSSVLSSTPFAIQPLSPTGGSGGIGSEGARLKRARIRRSSSSSSLESAHSAIIHKKHNQVSSGGDRMVATTLVSPPISPPMSPTHAPSKGTSKISLSQNASSSHAHTTARFEESATQAARRSRKSRSPPPTGRRPKSGSISTADRDQVLSVISPRQTSPRPVLTQSGPTGSKAIQSAVDDSIAPSNTSSSTINDATVPSRHTKSPSDGASVEGKSWELHRHSERIASERSSDKISGAKVIERLSEKTKERSSENVAEKSIENGKAVAEVSSAPAMVPSSESGGAPLGSATSIVTSQKKRSKGSKSGKSDLRVQINLSQQGSPISSPSSPGVVAPKDGLAMASMSGFATTGSMGVNGVGNGLLSSGVGSVPIYTAQEILAMADANGWLPLHTSVKQGNVRLTQYILSKGSPGMVLELANGMSVLDLAIQNQDATLATLLLEQGAPIMDAGPALQTFVGQKIILARNLDLAPTIPQSTFFGDMRALLNNSQFYDVTFMVDGKPVYGWKGLLATRCEVFRAMFTGALREANESNITISDVSYNSFFRIIEFIYTDSITSDKMNLDDALQLLAAANRYMLDRLKRIVERWLLSQLTDTNVAAIFHAADLYQAHHLRSSCILYVSTHLHRIPEPFEILNGTFRGVLLDFLKQPANLV